MDKILTYSNGTLQVIRGDEMLTTDNCKPDFIVGDNFFYEPTLKMTDNRPLTESECKQVEEFIDDFEFPQPVLYVPPTQVHCVDRYGNYLGYKVLSDGEIEVETPPSENKCGLTWNSIEKQWYESIVVNKTTGKIIGFCYNTSVENGGYVKASLVNQDFCWESQTFNFETKKFDIDITVVRTNKLNKLKDDMDSEVSKEIGILANGELTSWKTQEEEARAWLENNTVTTVLLDSILESSEIEDETKEDLVNKIIEKADAYNKLYGSLLGKFRRLRKIIESATTVEEIKAITW
jgi:hypothetical protein